MKLGKSMVLATFALTSLAAAASAQVAAPTTVQLPTFQVFSVNTTVSVPDGGGALLGGINRAADRSVSRGVGPFANRGIASTRSSSNMSVHATIIDHQELDEAILAQAAARRSPSAVDTVQVATNQKADFFITRNLARAERPAPVVMANAAPSVEEIRRRNELAAADRAAEAAVHFEKGLAAEANGKPNVAKIYYQMVVRQATGSLLYQAQEKLAALQSPRRQSSNQPALAAK